MAKKPCAKTCPNQASLACLPTYSGDLVWGRKLKCMCVVIYLSIHEILNVNELYTYVMY